MVSLNMVIESLEMAYRYSNVADGNTLVPQSLVIDAIELLKAQEQKCRECGEATSKAIQELQAKLKAQEAVSVQKKQMEMVGLQTWDWACGNCGQTVLFSARFCPWCGRAVKWDA